MSTKRAPPGIGPPSPTVKPVKKRKTADAAGQETPAFRLPSSGSSTTTAPGAPPTSKTTTYQLVGTIAHLFRKTGKGKAMEEQRSLRCVEQNGIVGNAGTSQAQLVEDSHEDGTCSTDTTSDAIAVADSSSTSTSVASWLALGSWFSKSSSGTKGSSAVAASGAGARKSKPNVDADATYTSSPWTLSPRQVLISSMQDLVDLSLSPGELRENVVIDLSLSGGEGPGSASCARHAKTTLKTLSETFPSGCVMQVGGGTGTGSHETSRAVLLRVTFGCEPCGHVLDRMKTLCPKKASYPTVKNMEGKRGLLATVLCAGQITQGDPVKILSSCSFGSTTFASMEMTPSIVKVSPLIKYEHFSDTPRVRFLTILRKVPHNKVITIKQLLIYSGAPPGYARALPAILKAALKMKSEDGNGGDAAGTKESCAHLVYSNLALFREDVVPEQKKTLEKRGVVVRKCSEVGMQADKSDWAVQKCALWRPTHSELFLV